jgi:hypothetical protein
VVDSILAAAKETEVYLLCSRISTFRRLALLANRAAPLKFLNFDPALQVPLCHLLIVGNQPG